MPRCDGQERHEHYQLSTGSTMTHSHEHTVADKEFNRLHHHAPIEHENFTIEQLTADAENLQIPF